MEEKTHEHEHHPGGQCKHCVKHCCGKRKIKVEQHTLGGGLWFIGWLFTIGFLHLSFWEGLLGLVVWPYFLGVHFAL